MVRRGHSVVFAALLLVAQLLLGVTSGGTGAHDGARHCDGCPGAHSISRSHDMGSSAGTPSGDHGGLHCGKHCSQDSSTGTGKPGCGSHCAMLGGGHCGSPANPALIATSSISPVIVTVAFRDDRRPVELPDSPLFDLLRPPTRA